VNTPSGVSAATMHWTIDTAAGYTDVTMTAMGSGNYHAEIPAQPEGTRVFYYIEASSNSGRTNRKPYVAPQGVYAFDVLMPVGESTKAVEAIELFQPYPVPANDRLNVSFYIKSGSDVRLTLTDMLGRNLQTIVLNNLERGVHQYEYNVTGLPVGNYMLQLRDETGRAAVKQISVAR
jgi:agmatine deiminase